MRMQIVLESFPTLEAIHVRIRRGYRSKSSFTSLESIQVIVVQLGKKFMYERKL